MTTRTKNLMTSTYAPFQTRTTRILRVTRRVRPHAENTRLLTRFSPPDLANFLSKKVLSRSTRGSLAPLIPSDPQPMIP